MSGALHCGQLGASQRPPCCSCVPHQPLHCRLTPGAACSSPHTAALPPAVTLQ